MSIREATECDVMQIQDLVASLSHFYMNDKFEDLPEWLKATLTEAEFLKRVLSADYSNFIYEIDGKVLGYISMKEVSHLFHLFVAETSHGKGISRSLWEFAQKACAAEKYTLRSSIFAVPVYRAFGFIETGPAGVKDGVEFQPMMLAR